MGSPLLGIDNNEASRIDILVKAILAVIPLESPDSMPFMGSIGCSEFSDLERLQIAGYCDRWQRILRRRLVAVFLGMLLVIAPLAVLFNGPLGILNGVFGSLTGLVFVFLVNFIASKWARRDRLTYLLVTIMLTIELLQDQMDDLQTPKSIDRQLQVRRVMRRRREKLRHNAWVSAECIALLAGRPRREWTWKPASRLGTWLCWASDDMTDRGRLEAVLPICVDVVRHIIKGRQKLVPSIQHPPTVAFIARPARFERRALFARGFENIRILWVAIVPLVAAIVSAILKK